MLIHSILNSSKTVQPHSLSLIDLKNRFQSRYGSIEKVMSCTLETYFKETAGFLLKEDNVTQTIDGAKECSIWFQKYNNHEVSTAKFEPSLKNKIAVPEVDHKRLASQWIVENHENVDNSDHPKIQDREWDMIEPLEKLLFDFDSRHSFFLISGKNTPPDKFNGIANIPWLKVYDFDTESQINGLCSSVENQLKISRSFSISCFSDDTTKLLSKNSTDWFFPLGSQKIKGTEYKGSALNWFEQYKPLLEQQFSSIANFCALHTMPVFLILWYDEDQTNLKYLNWLLSILNPAFKCKRPPKKIVLCLEEKIKILTRMEAIIDSYELDKSTVLISPEVLFKWFASKKVPKQPANNALRIPKKSAHRDEIEFEIVEIVEEHMWIKEYIEVLSLESQDQINQRQTDNYGKDFLKGGLISWDELASGNLAAEREGRENMWKYLEKDVLQKQKSMKIRILHAPGGGGTTFARQLLWDLHTKVPCGVVLPNAGLWISQIAERVRALNDKTHLPVVLLIEGRSENEIDQLFEICKYAIVILHVQRYSMNIPKNKFTPLTRTCLLPGKVTPKEADCLTTVFSSFSPKSEKALYKLTNEVKKKKEKFMFEYGLTAFNHEFKGVRKYVQGYLKLHEQKEGIKFLCDWQKVVAYLSLALYYGQSGLDCEIFWYVLKNKKNDFFVSLDDIEYSGRQFIIETKDRKWRISHNMVAKEILEQVLTDSTDSHLQSTATLSNKAKCKLHELVKNFIHLIKKAVNGGTPDHVVQVLMDMIIRRNNSEVEISDTIESIVYNKDQRKKGSLSRLLEDVSKTENRVEILQLLTKAFPQNAEFHAHLGRLLNMCKRFEEAEHYLQVAINIRTADLELMHVHPNSPDDMLGRIQHMFGMGYTLRAKQELSKAKKVMNGYEYKDLLNFVNEAVEHFCSARRYATRGFSYGLIGEVHARLLVSDYVHNKFPKGCLDAFEGGFGPDHIALSQFVCESHSVCDQLLADCLYKTSEQELNRVEDYTKCVENFTRFYRCIRQDMPLWKNESSNIHWRRSHIACLKMPQGNGNKHPCIGNVTRKKDLRTIINLHEETFRQIFREKSKISITMDMLEWLETIRHPWSNDCYSLMNVFETVSKWEKRNESVYGVYYSFAINFLLAVFTPGEDLNKEYYEKAKMYREKLQSKINKYDSGLWKIEWIANHKKMTIKKLINRKQLGPWNKEKRFWKEEKDIEKLQVFTGTVVRSQHPLKGTILLDVAQSNYKYQFEIYFVPKLYELDKSMFAEQKLRVEFCICLHHKHGAEAFWIKRLKTSYCRNCSMETEKITINARKGKCNKCKQML